MIRAISILLILTPFATQFLAQEEIAEDARPMSVCEVLRSLPTLRGKTIMVRGEWDGNLWGNCPGLLETKGYMWPSGIFVGLPTYRLIDSSQPIDWKTTFDESVVTAATRGAWAEWERLSAADRNRHTVLATVTGRLDVRREGLVVDAGGPVDYGVQNVFPAQLVMMGFSDIELSRVEKRYAGPPK